MASRGLDIERALVKLQDLRGHLSTEVDMDEGRLDQIWADLAFVEETLSAESAHQPLAPGRRVAPLPLGSQLVDLLRSGPESYLVTDSAGVIRAANPQAAGMLGVPFEFLPGKPLVLYLEPRAQRTMLGALASLAQGAQQQLIDVQLRPRGRPPVAASMLIAGSRSEDGEPVFWFVLRDEGDRRQQYDDLSVRANHDHLTGLMNGSHFIARVRAQLRTPGLRTGGVAVLFIDIDRFKTVNDTYGHSVGSELLQAVARRLAALLREGDFACRLGGDEFAVALAGLATAETAGALAERIRSTLAEPFTLGSGVVALTSVTVGVAISNAHTEHAEDLIREADQAMYSGKERGRNRVHLFGAAMRRENAYRKRVERRLDQAIRTGRLPVFYQPEFDLVSGRVMALEALVRWGSDGRLLPASEFISIAEDSGLIDSLGAFVVERVCADAGRWQAANVLESVSVAINMSPTELRRPGVLELLKSHAERHGLALTSLCVEITERDAMAQIALLNEPLDRLRAAGVRVALDDFGVGHSSLARLRELPFDIVKIDRSFVARLPDSREDRLIVATVCELADMLELEVVAEGIETADQLAALRTLGCRLGQGNLLAHPRAGEDIEGLLADGWRFDPATPPPAARAIPTPRGMTGADH